MTTRILMVRHGETQWNQETRLQGHQDSALTEKGLQQAHVLAQALVHQEKVSQGNFLICHSDLGRCVHTAQILQTKIPGPSLCLPELREISLGPWEGLTKAEIDEKWGQSRHTFWHQPEAHQTLPGAESFPFVQNRMLKALNQVLSGHRGRTVVLVSHGIALQCLMAGMEGTLLKDLWKNSVVGHSSLSVAEAHHKKETHEYSVISRDVRFS